MAEQQFMIDSTYYAEVGIDFIPIGERLFW